jgi:hypothetical protein
MFDDGSFGVRRSPLDQRNRLHNSMTPQLLLVLLYSMGVLAVLAYISTAAI